MPSPTPNTPVAPSCVALRRDDGDQQEEPDGVQTQHDRGEQPGAAPLGRAQRGPDPRPARRRCGAHAERPYACCDSVATATRSAAVPGPLGSPVMSIEALRDRMAELSDLTAVAPAGRLGPAHDDAVRGRGGPRRAARHARAARARARHRRRGGGVARGARGDGPGRARRGDRARGAPRLRPRAARPRRAGGRDRAGLLGGADDLAGRARGERLRGVRARRCGATSSSRASTPRASTASRAPTTRCSPTTTSASPPRACRPSSASSRRCWRRSSRTRRGRRRPTVQPPVDAQRAAVPALLERIGATRRRLADRRLRAPVQRGRSGGRDSRVTTRYEQGDLLSVIAAMHEFGHALYERQVAPGARAHEPRLGHVDVGARVPEQAVGEPRRPPSGVRPRDRRGARRRRVRRRAGGAARVAGRRAAVADPRLRRPGQLPAAHRAALRARARADRGRARRARPARARGTTGCGGCSASRSPTTRPACSRTPTGRRARSATSRATRSAA